MSTLPLLRVVLLSVAVLLLTACGGPAQNVGPSHPCGDDPSREVLAGKGEAAFAGTDFGLATACYARIVELYPDDVEGRAKLAEVHTLQARKSDDPATTAQHHAAAAAALQPALRQASGARQIELVGLYTLAAIQGGADTNARETLTAWLDEEGLSAELREALVGNIDRLTMAPVERLPAAKRQGFEARYKAALDTLAPHLYFGTEKPAPIATPEQQAAVDQAIASLRELARERPTWWRAWWLIGKAYEGQSDAPAAVEAFGKAWSINAYHPQAATAYLENLLYTRDLARALAVSEAAVRRFEHDPATLAKHARVLYAHCQVAEAKTFADRAARLDPADPGNESLRKVIAEVQAGKRECAIP